MESMIKKELKAWQKEFKTQHGRDPTRKDMAKHPKIAATYDTWHAIQEAKGEQGDTGKQQRAKKSGSSSSSSKHSHVDGRVGSVDKGKRKAEDSSSTTSPRKGNPFTTPRKGNKGFIYPSPTSRNPFATPEKNRKGKDKEKAIPIFADGKAYQSPSRVDLLAADGLDGKAGGKNGLGSLLNEAEKSATGGFTAITPRATRTVYPAGYIFPPAKSPSGPTSKRHAAGQENFVYVSPRYLHSPSKRDAVLTPSKKKQSPHKTRTPSKSYDAMILEDYTPRTKARKRLRGEDVPRTPAHKRRRKLLASVGLNANQASQREVRDESARPASQDTDVERGGARGSKSGMLGPPGGRQSAWARSISQGKFQKAASEELGATPPPEGLDEKDTQDVSFPSLFDDLPNPAAPQQSTSLPRSHEDAGHSVAGAAMEIDEKEPYKATKRRWQTEIIEAELSDDEAKDSKADGKGTVTTKRKVKLQLAPYMLYGRAGDKMDSHKDAASATEAEEESDENDFSLPFVQSPEKLSAHASHRKPDFAAVEPAHEEDESSDEEMLQHSHFAALTLHSPRAHALRGKRRATEQKFLQKILTFPDYDLAMEEFTAQAPAAENGDASAEINKTPMTWGAAKAREKAKDPTQVKGKGKAAAAAAAKAKAAQEERDKEAKAQQQRQRKRAVFSRAGRAGIGDDEEDVAADGQDDWSSHSPNHSDDDWASEVDDFDYGLGDGYMDPLDVDLM